MDSKKLPAGLYLRPNGVYFYRSPKDGERRFVTLGKIDREAAIKQWVKITGYRDEPAAQGTVAEIIDQYILEELPELVKLKQLSPATEKGYLALAPAVRKEFGDFRYAKTEAQSTDPTVLRTVDLTLYTRKFRNKRGAVQANRQLGFLSVVFSFARSLSICTYNPCKGAKRNSEQPRKRPIPAKTYEKLVAAMPKALRLIATLSDVTTLRKTDCRLLQLSNITDERVVVTPSKTNRKNDGAPPTLAFARTPAIEAILEEAKALPGRKISLFVFPTRKGTPYTENALQLAWNRAKKKAGLEDLDMTFRDIRTTEINAIRDSGGDATTAAGHADKRTTERHYITVATKVTPRR